MLGRISETRAESNHMRCTQSRELLDVRVVRQLGSGCLPGDILARDREVCEQRSPALDDVVQVDERHIRTEFAREGAGGITTDR